MPKIKSKANIQRKEYPCKYCKLIFRLKVARDNHEREHGFFPLLPEENEMYDHSGKKNKQALAGEVNSPEYIL